MQARRPSPPIDATSADSAVILSTLVTATELRSTVGAGGGADADAAADAAVA